MTIAEFCNFAGFCASSVLALSGIYQACHFVILGSKEIMVEEMRRREQLATEARSELVEAVKKEMQTEAMERWLGKSNGGQ